MMANGMGRGKPNESASLLTNGNSVMDRISAAFETLRFGFEGVLFSMEHEQSTAQVVFLLEVTIDTCQMLSLVIPRKESMLFGPISTVWDSFAQLFAYTQFDFLLREWIGQFPVLIVALVLVLFEFFNIAIFAISWTKNEFRSLWTVKLLRNTTHLLVTVLYIPILSTFFADSFACNNLPSVWCYILTPVTIAVSIVFILFSLAVSLALFDMSPTGGRTAMPHAQFLTLHLGVQTLWVITGSIIGQGGETEITLGSKALWMFITVVPSFALCYCFVWYQPYYHCSSSTVRGIASCIIAFTAFAVAALLIIHHGETEKRTTTSDIGILFVGGWILLIPSALSIIKQRRVHVVQKPLDKCHNGFEVELKGRIFLTNNSVRTPLDLESPEFKAKLEQVKKWYVEAMAMFPTSANVCVFYAEFLIAYDPSSHAIHVRNILAQAQRRDPGIQFGFTIFKARRALEQDAMKNTDIVSVISREKFEKEAAEGDKQSSVFMYDLWNELEKRNPDEAIVTALAEKINIVTRSAAIAYSKLLQMSPHDTQLMRRYGTFLMEVANDPRHGSSMLQKAEQIDRFNTNNGINSYTDLDNVQSELCGVVVIGTLDRERNIVLSCNATAARIMRVSQRAIVGNTFNDFFVADPDNPVDIVKFLENNSPESCINIVLEDILLMANSSEYPTTVRVNMKMRPFTPDGADCNVIISFIPTPDHREQVYLISDTTALPLPTVEEEEHKIEEERPLLSSRLLRPQSLYSIRGKEEQPKLGTILGVSTALKESARRFDMELTKKDRQPLDFMTNFINFMNERNEFSEEEEPRSADELVIFELRELCYLGTTVTEWLVVDPRLVHAAEQQDVFSNEADDSIQDDFDEMQGSYHSSDESEEEVAPPILRDGKNALEPDFPAPITSDAKLPMNGAQQSPNSSTKGFRSPKASEGLASVRAGVSPKSDASKASKPRTKVASIGSSVGETWDQIKERIQHAGSRTHPTIQNVGQMYSLAVLATILLMGAEIVFQNAYIRRFERDLSSTANASYLVLAAAKVAYVVHSVALVKQGIDLSYPGSGFDMKSALPGYLKEYSANMREWELGLYDSRDYFSDELSAVYMSPDAVSMYQASGMNTNISILEAVLTVSGMGQLVATSDMNVTIAEDTSILTRLWTVIQNSFGENSLTDELMNISYIHAADGEARIQQLFPLSEILSISILLITVLLLARTINPLLVSGSANSVDMSRKEVMEVLYSIPKATLAEVKARYRYRLETEHDYFIADIEEEIKRAENNDVRDSARQLRKVPSKIMPISANATQSKADNHKIIDSIIESTEETNKAMDRKRRCRLCFCKDFVTFAKTLKASLYLKRNMILRTYSMVFLCVIYWILNSSYGMLSLERVLTSASYDINDFIRISSYQLLIFSTLRLSVAQMDPSANLPQVSFQHSEILRYLEDAERLFIQVINGDPSRGSLGIFKRQTEYQCPEVRALFLENACIGHADQANCEKSLNGVLSSGLHTGLVEILNVLREVYSFSFLSNTSSVQAWVYMASGGEQFLSLYLLPQITLMVDSQVTFLMDLIEQSKSDRNKIFAVFSLCCALSFFVIVRPMLSKLDKSVQRSRRLLLLLPTDIVEDAQIKRKIAKLSFAQSSHKGRK